ncbi:hypothetical protein FISHEDRAFT_16389, partial [Fistulina hepatica ATCC 64428]
SFNEPATNKSTQTGADARFAYGVASMQGWRITMEDAHTAILALDTAQTRNFFAVYDGHKNGDASAFAGRHLHHRLVLEATPRLHEKTANDPWADALRAAFLGTDEDMLADPDLKRSEGGCTAVSALITPEGILYVANAGDSRAVLCSAGKAKDLSTDHKPVNPGESERISASGGWIQNQRLNGDLALSRALGDFRYKNKKDLPPEKQPLTAYPDVTEHRLTEDDEFMIIACDGIWDVLSSQSVVDYVRLEIARGRELLGQISEAVCEYCLSPELGNGGIGMDNMTILIVAIL